MQNLGILRTYETYSEYRESLEYSLYRILQFILAFKN